MTPWKVKGALVSLMLWAYQERWGKKQLEAGKKEKGKEASMKEGTNNMIMGEVSELHMLELVGKAMVVGHVLYVSSGEVMGSLVIIM